MDRRQFLVAVAAAGGAMALGVRPANAETKVKLVVWQRHDGPLKVGTLLKDIGISLSTT